MGGDIYAVHAPDNLLLRRYACNFRIFDGIVTLSLTKCQDLSLSILDHIFEFRVVLVVCLVFADVLSVCGRE